MLRILGVLVVAAALSVSGAIGLVGTSVPSDPPAPAVAVEVPFAGGADVGDVVIALQQRLERLPEDHRAWAQLGLAYVEQARVTGNPAYYAKAERAVSRSLTLEPTDNADALAARASLAAARHDFDRALRDAVRALKINPRHSDALLARVDALTELGRYAEQLAALRQADNRQPGIPVAARYAYAYELRGGQARALDVLLEWADTGSRADRAYLLTLAADLERRRGDLTQSARHLRVALRSSSGYVPALVSLARLDVARGEPRSALRRWREIVERLPLPEYLTELGELLMHLGHQPEGRRVLSVVESTVSLLQRGGVNSDLEAALFDADHGSAARALDAARAEWDRRHSVHTADVLGWALHRAGQHRAALELARQATRLGTPEPRFWVHRGLIERALGLDGQAVRHLRLGLSLDPGLSPWQAERATRALAGLVGADQ